MLTVPHSCLCLLCEPARDFDGRDAAHQHLLTVHAGDVTNVTWIEQDVRTTDGALIGKMQLGFAPRYEGHVAWCSSVKCQTEAARIADIEQHAHRVAGERLRRLNEPELPDSE